MEVGRHLKALDGVRGFAILLVFLFHANFFARIEARGASGQLATIACGTGWIGVDLFFVLSGFLITRSLLASVRSEKYFTVFYMRRILRICPLYYCAVLVFVFILPLLGIFPRGAYSWPVWTYTLNASIAA